MAYSLVPEPLWEEIQPLLPREPAKPKGGRPRVPDRDVLTGMAYVLRTGTAWRLVPKELGCGSGVTCWRRMRAWTRAGIWPEVFRRMVVALGRAGEIDLSHAIIDSQSFRAVFGGRTRARTRRIGRKTAANGT